MAEGEGYDREHYDLPYNQTALLRQILKITDQVGFISFGGAPYDMEFPARCKALLQMYLGGESVGKACADIVMGQVNPSANLRKVFRSVKEMCQVTDILESRADRKRHWTM